MNYNEKQIVKVGDALLCKQNIYSTGVWGSTFFLKRIWQSIFLKPIFEKGKKYIVSDVRHEVVSYSGTIEVHFEYYIYVILNDVGYLMLFINSNILKMFDLPNDIRLKKLKKLNKKNYI